MRCAGARAASLASWRTWAALRLLETLLKGKSKYGIASVNSNNASHQFCVDVDQRPHNAWTASLIC